MTEAPDQTAVVRLDACPLCRGGSLRDLPRPGRWVASQVFAPVRSELGLQRCLGCGLVFTNPRPSPALLSRVYAGDAYSYHQPDLSPAGLAKADFIMAVVERHLAGKPGLSLFDFGCGGGLLLRQAQARGWRAVGFEVGQAALEACRRQGLEATGDLDSLEAGSFDAVVLNHVFEHLDDYAWVLGRMGALLRPGGALFVETPNAASLRARLSLPHLSRHWGFDERYRAYPTHLSYFTPRTLPRALAAHGFRTEAVVTSGLGLEELRWRQEEERPCDQAQAPVPAPRAATARQAGGGGGLKGALKRLFFGLGLGENVLVVARVG